MQSNCSPLSLHSEVSSIPALASVHSFLKQNYQMQIDLLNQLHCTCHSTQLNISYFCVCTFKSLRLILYVSDHCSHTPLSFRSTFPGKLGEKEEAAIPRSPNSRRPDMAGRGSLPKRGCSSPCGL